MRRAFFARDARVIENRFHIRRTKKGDIKANGNRERDARVCAGGPPKRGDEPRALFRFPYAYIYVIHIHAASMNL